MNAWTIFALMLIAYAVGAIVGANDEDTATGTVVIGLMVAFTIIIVRVTLFYALP